VKKYVAAVEALTKKKRKDGSKQDETQFGIKSGAFSEFDPQLKAKANALFFARFFSGISPGFGPNSGFLVPCFSDFTENSNL
jgi:hypothetical protein